MTPHIVLPLISMVLTSILALVSWTYGRGRLTRAFALFATALTLVGLLSFLTTTATSPAGVRFWFRLMVLCMPLALGCAVYHVMVLTGYIHRLSERFLGITLRRYIRLFVVNVIVLQTLLQGTTLIVDLDSVTHDQMLSFRLNPLSVAAGSAIFYLAITMFAMLFRARKESRPGLHRAFLDLTIVGMFLVYGVGPGLAKSLYFFGYDGLPFLFVGYSAAAVIFYLATVRYQFQRIDELNRGLEETVERRTEKLRQTQAQLAQAEKMAALGRLVAGVAHEINNPMGAVRSTSDTLRRQLDTLQQKAAESPEPDGDLARLTGKLKRGLAVINQGSCRVTAIIDKLRSFAGLDRAEQRPMDLNRCVDESAELLLSLEKDRITVHRNNGELPKILCCPAQVNQVLQSLLINAAEAIEGKGTITVTTEAHEQHITLAVADTGKGIAAQHQEHLFEPGFTTKSRGVGTGLGLAIAYQVMREHNGTVDINSKEGQGTTVTLDFPLVAP